MRNECVKVDMKGLGSSRKKGIEISGRVGHLGTVQHCLSAVMSVWFFTDCIPTMLIVNVEHNDAQVTHIGYPQ